MYVTYLPFRHFAPFVLGGGDKTLGGGFFFSMCTEYDSSR